MVFQRLLCDAFYLEGAANPVLQQIPNEVKGIHQDAIVCGLPYGKMEFDIGLKKITRHFPAALHLVEMDSDLF